MILTIILVTLVFLWLGKETQWLTIRLLVGREKPPKYACYVVYNAINKKRSDWQFLKKGDNYPEGYTPNGEPEYTIVLSPNVDNVLCGWDWLNEHCASMVDYQPELYLAMGGVRYNMTIKQPLILTEVMKANKLNKAQKLAYA